MKGILKSVYTLIHDTSARRADYISITECDKFPFAYCATRWVEDKKVADRAVEIWPNIKKVVEKWEKLAPSERPKGKNYQTVLAAIKDNLITAKLNYFSFIASILQPFLTKYQSDDPLVSFMYDDVLSLITSLMRLIFKADKVDEAALKNFKEFDFTLNDNRLPLNSINIGCAAANSIVDLKQ